MNKQGKNGISWTEWTWNPVVGCKHGCPYCYAKRMNDRFKWIEKWDRPQIFVERLDEPYKLKKPSKIFVGSMCDLFGDWIGDDWMEPIMSVVNNNPQHTFQFLTKNPKRYLEFDFPKNCWLGTTITNGKAGWRIIDLVRKNNYKFISFEPLLGRFGKEMNNWLKGIDLVIVGAMTGRGAIKPKKEWIDSIKHPNIFYKENIKKFL